MSEETVFVHPLVGHPDGYVDHNNETIVYEYDEDGEFAGWHKEPEGESQNQKEAREVAERKEEEE